MEVDEEIQDLLDAVTATTNTSNSSNNNDQGNLEQLLALQQELTHFVEHGVDPEEEWYTVRYPYIELYAQLRWADFANTFRDNDDYLYEFSMAIHMMLGELIHEYSTRPTFNFEMYCSAINSIAELWDYYSKKYMGSETDLDVVDLIEAMSFMKT
jgi:hypothetical protein